jgi:hypothetical protein
MMDARRPEPGPGPGPEPGPGPGPEPSASPLANTVFMLFERMQRLEDELGEVKAELASAKGRLGADARFEGAIDGIGDVPGFGCSLDDFLVRNLRRNMWCCDRAEQLAWLHRETRSRRLPCGAVVIIETKPLDARMEAFLEKHGASARLDIFTCGLSRIYDVRHALWLAAREDICDRIGVFCGAEWGDAVIVLRANCV